MSARAAAMIPSRPTPSSEACGRPRFLFRFCCPPDFLLATSASRENHVDTTFLRVAKGGRGGPFHVQPLNFLWARHPT